MKAWVLNGIGDIRYQDVEIPELMENEVRVKVMAAGICGSDIPRIYKTGAHKMPLIPGHEFSGIVERIGEDVDPSWLGKRVGVYPLIACGKCAPCMGGHPEMCRDYDYIGSRRDGAFAEYVVVPVNNLAEIPDNVSFEQAAMLEPMAVAVHAMCKGVGESGDTVPLDAKVAVCGLGTIGLLLTMFLIDRGYRNIFVIGNKPSQKDRATEIGTSPENCYDSSKGNAAGWLKDKTDGADVYFECVGRNECVSCGIDSAAPGGRIVLVGNPYSDMQLSKDTYWKILRNQLSVIGTWNSTYLQRSRNSGFATDDWGYVVKRLEEGKIHPEKLITHRFDLSELNRGFEIMRDKTEDYCKVVSIRDEAEPDQ